MPALPNARLFKMHKYHFMQALQLNFRLAAFRLILQLSVQLLYLSNGYFYGMCLL
jgi:hypothetical protein